MIQTYDVSHEQIEQLCAGYRAGIEEPAFDAADRRLLSAAARSARYRFLQRRVRAPATVALIALLAVLTSALAGWRALSAAHQSSTPAAALLTRNDGPVPAALRLTAVHAVYTQAVAPALLAAPAAAVVVPQVVLPPLVMARAGAPPAPLVTPPGVPPAPIVTLPVAAASSPLLAPTASFSIASAAVDLNVPGALASLQASRPADYARIMAILSGITQRPQSDVPRWLQATFGARDVLYQPVWLTSLPPKRHLDFSLENRRYRAVLTITDQGAWPFPVEAAPRYRCGNGRCEVMPDRAPLKAPAR